MSIEAQYYLNLLSPYICYAYGYWVSYFGKMLDTVRRNKNEKGLDDLPLSLYFLQLQTSELNLIYFHLFLGDWLDKKPLQSC